MPPGNIAASWLTIQMGSDSANHRGPWLCQIRRAAAGASSPATRSRSARPSRFWATWVRDRAWSRTRSGRDGATLSDYGDPRPPTSRDVLDAGRRRLGSGHRDLCVSVDEHDLIVRTEFGGECVAQRHPLDVVVSFRFPATQPASGSWTASDQRRSVGRSCLERRENRPTPSAVTVSPHGEVAVVDVGHGTSSGRAGTR